jgi:Cu/Ag efflux pump CusA
MLKLRRLVAALAVVLIIVGILQLRSAPVDVLPEFLPATVDVQTEALGLSAEEVEQLITVTLEQDLVRGVAWLNTIQSESVPGLSSIHLTFDRGTDLLKARQLVQERVQSSDLTNVSKPPQMLQPTSSTGRVTMIGLSSKTMSLMQMSVLARWTIVPKLTGVPGVANVATWGQRDEQLQVLVDPQRLQQHDVSLDTIITTAGNALWFSPLTFLEASSPGTGGFIDTANQRLSIMHLFPISTPEQLGQVALEQVGDQATTPTTAPASGGSTATTATTEPPDIVPGSTPTTAPSSTTPTTAASATPSPTPTTEKPLLLGDVATIVEDHQPLIGDALFTNGPGLLLVINKLPGADVEQVTKGIQAALEELKPGLADMTFDYNVFRPATYIELGISNVALGLIIGAVLLLLALAALFFDWRNVVMSAVVIALGLAVASLALRLLGFSLNWMTMAGLIIGLVVAIDVSVSYATYIRRRLAEWDGAGERDGARAVILQAAREIRGDVVYVTVIVLVALLPIFAARGSTGALIRDLSVAFALMVVASAAAALLVGLALALMLVPKKRGGEWEAPLVRWFKRGYGRALSWMIALPRRSYVPALVVAVIAIVMVPFLSGSVVPPLKDTNVLVEFKAQPGTSLPEMARVVGLAGTEIKAIPGVKDVGGHIGRAVLGDQVVNVDSSVLWLNIDETQDYGKTLAAIREVASGYPGLSTDVVTYPNSQFAAASPDSKGKLTVRIFGQELDTLRSLAADVNSMLKGVKGVAGTTVENLAEEPGINIEVNLAAAQQYGIKPGDVRREATTLISSIVVGGLFEQEKIFDVVVVADPKVRADLNSIRDLLIDTPSGQRVKLSDVANVTIGPTPTVLRHDATSRKIDVTVDVSSRNVESVAGDVRSQLAQVSFPPEYHAEVLGLAGETTTGIWLLVLGAVAIFGIFLLLQSSLGSWLLALLVLLSALVALSGGVVAAFFMSRTISPPVLLGLLAIFGIAVRSALLLIRDCREQERKDSEGAAEDPAAKSRPPLAIVLQAAGGQFGTLVLTIVAAGLMLLPLAIMGRDEGLEVLYAPLVAILASLVTLAFVGLFVMPALYVRFAGSWRRHDDTI